MNKTNICARIPPNSGVVRVFLLLCGSLLAASAIGSSARAASAAKAPPHLEIDLNAFDASKKLMALPNGESLAYIDRGERTGPAVVLIHGYTDNARDWVPMLPYVSKRYRLILVDIRGHGQSSKPECCYTRLDFAYDIKLLLDALGVQKADIVGHSLGSIIAQTFAEYWPERTAHVALISSTGGPPPDRPKKPPQFDFAAEIRKLKEPIEADSPFMIAWWDSPTPVDPDFIRRQRKDAAGIPLRVWLAVLDQALPADNIYGDLQSSLPRLKAPTLLIWGSKDPIMEEDVRQSLRNALPNAQVKIFDGLGHNPFWEDPRGVAEVINAFLSTPISQTGC
jgi:pimeloyl-ACP methyl ester carboxylesterase